MKLAALVLWLLLALPCVLALVTFPVWLFFTDRVDWLKRLLRCYTETTNVMLFNGSPYESTSSHAWRARDKAWAKAVIAITDLLEPGHCEGANRREQPLLDAVANLKDGGVRK